MRPGLSTRIGNLPWWSHRSHRSVPPKVCRIGCSTTGTPGPTRYHGCPVCKNVFRKSSSFGVGWLKIDRGRAGLCSKWNRAPAVLHARRTGVGDMLPDCSPSLVVSGLRLVITSRYCCSAAILL